MEYFFKTNDLEISYLKEGESETRLVFIHGAFCQKEQWLKQIDFFSKEYEVVAIDLLGHGESSKIAPKDCVEKSVDIILEFLNSLDKKQTVLLGHSFGGSIVNRLSQFLDQTFACIYIDSSCLSGHEDIQEYRGWGKEIMSSSDPKAFIQKWFSSTFSKNCPQEVQERILKQLSLYSVEWVSGLMEHYPSPKKTNEKEKVIVLEGSQFYPLDNDKSWRYFFSEASLWEFKGEGHFYFIWDDQRFNKALGEQLQKLIS